MQRERKGFGAHGRQIALAAVLVLCGCGTISSGFVNGFDNGFRQSCLEGATKKGAPKEVAQRYCECALAKFKETRSMDQAAKACLPAARAPGQ